MKYFIGIVVVVGIIVAGFFLLPSLKDDSSISPSGSTQTGPGDTSELFVIVGGVTVQRSGDKSATSVTDTASVTQGDRIITNDTGRARLTYKDGTITTIEPGSDITLSELTDEGNKSRITLNVGDIWSKVTQVLGVDDHYEVQTNETVAAVRGTIFRSTYRNKRSMIQGIESTVRVFVRNTDGTTDETSGADITENTVVGVDATIVARPQGQRNILARKLTAEELRDPILLRIQTERNLRNEQLDRSDRLQSPLVSPRITLSPRPTYTVEPRLTPPLYPSIPPLPTDIPPISSILPYISNLPVSAVTLRSVVPSTVAAGAKFIVNGSNFTKDRNTPRVVGVLVGYQPADFAITSSGDMFVTAPNVSPGTYEITVTTDEGTLVNLKPGITIR